MSVIERDYGPIGNLPTMVKLSLGLRRIVEVVGQYASFLIIPLIIITIFDVTARKLIWIQIFLVEHVSKFFESTLLQELEWHFHTGLFALVLGFGTVYNRHVRVDLVREKLHFRKQVWIEWIGTTIGMIPYTAIVIFFAFQFALESWETSEISASQVGLTHRWIIKSILLVGLGVALTSGVAVWLQLTVVLFGPRDLRFRLMTMDWPEERDDHRIVVEGLDADGNEAAAGEGGDGGQQRPG